MERPTTIRIGSLCYTFEWTDGNWTASTERYGECDYIPQIIRINGQLRPDRLATNVVHEIIHAMLEHSPHGHDNWSNEEIAKHLGYMLAGVWRDNPEVFDWWRSLLV